MPSRRPVIAAQPGFTLVELAIVMIIIGLVIGGVLKGQALISNAQTTATIAQIRAFDAAISTFRDQYGTAPGDMVNPGTRLFNCTDPVYCSAPGNGDGRINFGNNTSVTFNGDQGEQKTAWSQLAAASLITGVNTAKGASWGGAYPATKYGNNINGYSIGWFKGGAGLGDSMEQDANTRPGTYLSIHGTAGGPSFNDPALTPNQAQRIDTKIDDGAPRIRYGFGGPGGKPQY